MAQTESARRLLLDALRWLDAIDNGDDLDVALRNAQWAAVEAFDEMEAAYRRLSSARV